MIPADHSADAAAVTFEKLDDNVRRGVLGVWASKGALEISRSVIGFARRPEPNVTKVLGNKSMITRLSSQNARGKSTDVGGDGAVLCA